MEVCSRAWVEQFLVPELRAGDIVVMDNSLAKRKSPGKKGVAKAKRGGTNGGTKTHDGK